MHWDYSEWKLHHPRTGPGMHLTHDMFNGSQIVLCCDTCAMAITLDAVAAGVPCVDNAAAKKYLHNLHVQQTGKGEEIP